MASQSQGIQQLLQAEKRAAEKVSEARKREFRGGAARPRAVVGGCGPKPCGVGVWADTVAEACMFRSFMSLSLWKVVGRLKLRCGLVDPAWRQQWLGVFVGVSEACKWLSKRNSLVSPLPLAPLGCSVSVKGATVYTVAQSRDRVLFATSPSLVRHVLSSRFIYLFTVTSSLPQPSLLI